MKVIMAVLSGTLHRALRMVLTTRDSARSGGGYYEDSLRGNPEEEPLIPEQVRDPI